MARKNGDSSSLSLSLSLSFSYSHFSNVSRDHGYIIKRVVVPIQRNIQSLFFLSFFLLFEKYSCKIRVNKFRNESDPRSASYLNGFDEDGKKTRNTTRERER